MPACRHRPRERGRPRPHQRNASKPARAPGLPHLALLLTFATLSLAATPPVLLLDAALVGSDIVAVGEHGTLLRSPDSGQTWTPAAFSATATLTGIAFAPDARHGWAVGHDALILVTADAGRTWQKQWQGENLESSFLDVCVLDATHVIAVGAYGLCRSTSDAGQHWRPQKIIDDDMHLNRLTRGPTGTLYLAGERGTLLRSRDGGATWQRIDSPYDGSFYGILPLGERTLLAYGLRGRVFRSTDDGEIWLPVQLDAPMMIATAIRTTAGTIILAGQARAFYRSDDNGASFAAFSPGFFDAVAELLEAPDGALLAFGEAGAAPVETGRQPPASPPFAKVPIAKR